MMQPPAAVPVQAAARVPIGRAVVAPVQALAARKLMTAVTPMVTNYSNHRWI